MSILQFSLAAEGIARTALIATIAAAPFLIGGVPALFQLWLACGVIVAFSLWLLSATLKWVSGISVSEVLIPLPIVLLALLFILGLCQVTIPLSPRGISSPWALELARSLNLNPQRLIAGSPIFFRQAIECQNARIMIVLAAGFLGTHLFTSRRHFSWLFGTLATVGAVISLIGIAQRINPDNQLLDFFSLRYGASPFATFVNRSNAAGFLNVCLAASVGGIVLNSSERRNRSDSSRILIFLVLSTIIVAGVVASLSRGGMIASVLAFFAVFHLIYRRFGKACIWGSIAVGAAAVIFSTCYHFADAASSRLSSLRNMSSALNGRWDHWIDTSRAIVDRPWLGSGWGTYRYANLPYQEHETTVWFWNADNQYLEIAVEGGLIGLFIVFCMIFTAYVSFLKLKLKEPSSFVAALTATGLFMLVSLCVQMATDFGVTLLSIGLPCSVLMGGILGTEMRMRYKQTPGARGRGVVTPLALMISFVVLITCGTSWAGWTIVRLQPVQSLRERVPLVLNDREQLEKAELNELIQDARTLLREFPDHPELSFDLSRLLFYQFQQDHLDEVLPEIRSSSKTKAWDQSSLDALFERSRLTAFSGRQEGLISRASFQSSVPESASILRTSLESLPWIPGFYTRLIMLSTLSGLSEDQITTETMLAHEALLAAGNVDRLLNIGHIALKGNLDALAILCWKRALTLREDLVGDVVQLARLGFEDDYICEQLLSTPEQLIAFSRMTQDLAAKKSLTQRLESVQLELKDVKREQGRTAWISAHIALLSERQEDATERFLTAIRHEPFQVQWRLELVDLLISMQDWAAAREQLVFTSNLDPHNEVIRERLGFVIENQLRTRKGAVIESPATSKETMQL